MSKYREKCHWEYRENEDGREVGVIVCDQPGCDWEGTAYASQFVIHHSRRHEEDNA